MSPRRTKNKTCQREDELLESQRPACIRHCGALRAQLDRLDLVVIHHILPYLQPSRLLCGQITRDERERLATLRNSPSLLSNSRDIQDITPHPVHLSPVVIEDWWSRRCRYTGSCGHRPSHRQPSALGSLTTGLKQGWSSGAPSLTEQSSLGIPLLTSMAWGRG